MKTNKILGFAAVACALTLTLTSCSTNDNPVEEQTPTVADLGDSEEAAPAADGISQDEVLDSFTGQQRIPFDD